MLPVSRHRRESPEVLDLRRAMRARGVSLRRERGLDDWSLFWAPACAGNRIAGGTLAEVKTVWAAVQSLLDTRKL